MNVFYFSWQGESNFMSPSSAVGSAQSHIHGAVARRANLSIEWHYAPCSGLFIITHGFSSHTASCGPAKGMAVEFENVAAHIRSHAFCTMAL